MIIPSHPVFTCAEAKAWETRILTDEGQEWQAMQRAGAGVARALVDDYREIGGLPAKARILVLAGKGHNGGDALLVAREILGEYPDARATVVLVFDRENSRPLVKRALDELDRMAGSRLTVVELSAGAFRLSAFEGAASWDVCLDGIFGFQFRAPMDAEVVRFLADVNACPGIRLRAAIDLPSGLGEADTAAVFRADFTYATGIVKHPVLAPRNAAFVGRLRAVDIGLVDEASAPEAAERVLTAKLLAPLGGLRAAQSDKRTYGHLLVVGGSHSYPGAVVLAARAALRAGTGLVTAFVPEKLAPEYATAHSEIMWVGCPVTPGGGLAEATRELVRARSAKANALLIGPGLGADPVTLALAAELAGEATVPLMLDADALRPEVIARVRDKAFICTPHAGEFARIAPALCPDDKFAAPQGVLVLKGPLTRVTDGKFAYHSPFGGPVLARGGSGDILAGLIGGLLAQGPMNPLLAACRGVVWHGRAADLLARTRGQVAVETSEILEQLGPALISTP